MGDVMIGRKFALDTDHPDADTKRHTAYYFEKLLTMIDSQYWGFVQLVQCQRMLTTKQWTFVLADLEDSVERATGCFSEVHQKFVQMELQGLVAKLNAGSYYEVVEAQMRDRERYRTLSLKEIVEQNIRAGRDPLLECKTEGTD